MKRTTEAARILAPVGITAGLATFFFGISGYNNHWANYWTNILCGVGLMVIGFILLFVYLSTIQAPPTK